MNKKKMIYKFTKISLTICCLLFAVFLTTCEAKAEVNLDGSYQATVGLQMEEDPDLIPSGTYTNIAITGNGTYTVSLEGIDSNHTTAVSSIFAGTNIPGNDMIQYADVHCTINGTEQFAIGQPATGSAINTLGGGTNILVTSANDRVQLQGDGSDSIQITFTVEGFNFDNPNDALAADSAPEGSTPSAEPTLLPTSTGMHSSIPSWVFILIPTIVFLVAGGFIYFVIKTRP